MAHGGNVIEELKADHREVEEMFNQINALPPGDPQRRRIADDFTIELVRHSVAEEMYLYPAVRERVTGGAAMADKELDDHATVEELLKELEGMDADHSGFDTLVARVISEVAAHVADEEARLFPALATACTPAELDELGDKIRSAKAKAPTRPHPAAPDPPADEQARRPRHRAGRSGPRPALRPRPLLTPAPARARLVPRRPSTARGPAGFRCWAAHVSARNSAAPGPGWGHEHPRRA